MKRTIISILILNAALCGVMPGAETNEAPTVTARTNSATLDALVAETLDRNPELKFYEAEIQIAKAGRKNAGRFANPEVSGGVGNKTARGGGLSAEGVAWSVSLAQPFEWPGRISLRKAIANRDIELAELGYDRFKIALCGRVRALACELLAAQEKAAGARVVAERFAALREVLVQRDPAGLTPLLEMRIIEATELSMHRKASDATIATQAALLELNQLRGVAADTHLAVRESPLDFRPAESRETLLASARTNNFELRARTMELEQQGFRVDLAKNERFPPVSIGPTMSEENAGDRERIIGVGVSLPLPLWNRNNGNIEAAVARQTQAQASLNVAMREVERKIVAVAMTYEAKLREMSKWQPDSVRHFREAAELADRHYRLGAVPIATYVELQKQYLETVETLLDTKKEALELAQQLELLTGFPAPLSNAPAKEEAP